MPCNPTPTTTLTPAAQRMLTVTHGPQFIRNIEASLLGNPMARHAALDLIAKYNAAAEAAQEPPAWVPVADVPEEWKDGRKLVARFHGGNPYSCVIVEYTQSSGTWCGDNGAVEVSHLCDCIPRRGP